MFERSVHGHRQANDRDRDSALQYQDAPAAIDFLCKAFGFEKKAVYEGEGGSIAHAELTLGNGMVMLGSAKETDYGKLLVRPHQVGGVTMSTLHRDQGRLTRWRSARIPTGSPVRAGGAFQQGPAYPLHRDDAATVRDEPAD